MSEIVQLITIITPKPGKIDEVVEKTARYNAFVEASEPGALQYELFRQVNGDTEVLVYIEVFKNRAAMEVHSKSGERTELLRMAAEDDLLACPPDIKELKHVGGFARRG